MKLIAENECQDMVVEVGLVFNVSKSRPHQKVKNSSHNPTPEADQGGKLVPNEALRASYRFQSKAPAWHCAVNAFTWPVTRCSLQHVEQLPHRDKMGDPAIQQDEIDYSNPPFPLTSIDRGLLAMKDEDFHRITWDDLKQIIGMAS